MALTSNSFSLIDESEKEKKSNLTAGSFSLLEGSSLQGDNKINFNRDDIYTIQSKLNSPTLPFVEYQPYDQYDQSGVELGKAARYGWYQGWSGALYTSSGIPGWVDRGLDGAINLFGGDSDKWAYDYYYGEDFAKDYGILSEEDYKKAEDTLRGKNVFRNYKEMPGEPGSFKRAAFHTLATIDNWEEWLKEKAYGMRPEEQDWYTGFRPEGIIEKTISGFGGALPTIGTIAAATYLTRSPMAGFALIAFLDSYEESLGKAAWHTLLGGIEGKLFGAVAGMRPWDPIKKTGVTWRAKAAGFASIGAGSAAVHGGDYTDVISGAIVMGTFAVPVISGPMKALGFKTQKEADIAAEKEIQLDIKEGKTEVGETKIRIDLHKEEAVGPFNRNKKESGYNKEVERDIIELDPRTKKERKRIVADKRNRGNLEKLESTKETQKQIDRGDDRITFKRIIEETKPKNRPIERVKSTEEVKEGIEKKELKETSKELEIEREAEIARAPKKETITIDRDSVIKDGEYLDVYVTLDPTGKVTGLADYTTRTEGFSPRRETYPEGSALAFAERYGLKLGKDGSVIAKLSDLIRIKNDKTLKIKGTSSWLTEAIKDTTSIKLKLETDMVKRVKDYGKVIDRSLNAADTIYSALMVAEGYKNIGLSYETSAKETDAIIYETKKDGTIDRKLDKDGRPQEIDPYEKDVGKILKSLNDGLQKLELYTIAPKFIGGPQSSRIIKAFTSAISRMHWETEAMVDAIHYKKRFVTEKDQIYDQKYIMEEGGTFKGIRTWLTTALHDVVPQRGLDGSMTRFELLVQRGGKKGVESAIKIMRARIDRDNVMYDEALKNVKSERTNKKVEKEYLKQNKDGSFKYQMSYERMANEFKLSKEEIEIIKLMDQGLKLEAQIYNLSVRKYKSQEGKEIQMRPNYDPRSWFGKERAFIKAKEDLILESGLKVKKGDTVAVIPGHNKTELKAFLKFFKEKNTEFADTSKYETILFRKDQYGEKSGQPVIDAFKTSHEYYNILPAEIVSKIRAAEKDFRGKQAFFTAPRHRAGVRGFAGEQPGMEGLQNYIRAHKDYGTGAIRAATSMKFKHNWEIHLHSEIGQRWRKDFPNQMDVVQKYMDNALGRNDAAVTKVLNKTVEVISDRFRSIVENIPVLNKTPDVLLSANKLTLYTKLLLWNVRFMQAQLVQPWQVIIPKLEQLKIDHKINGNVPEALLRGSYEIFMRSDKEFVQALAVAVERGWIDQKFLKEFNDYLQGGKIQTKGKRKVSNIADILSGKTASGAIERFSRMQSFAFMYYFLKSAKRDEAVGRKQMIEEAGELTNNLMVEYDYKNRAFLYGNKGLGKLGALVGLFKTFQHNYYGKTAEYIRTWARHGFSKGSEPLLHHLYSQIFTAGLFGLMAIEQADALVDWMNRTLASHGKEPMFTTPSELILVSDLPTSAKFGLPSAAIGGDMSSTLAAPGMGISDIFSFPSMDYLFGVQSSNHTGVIGEGLNFTAKTIAGSMTDSDVYKFLKVMSPPLLQGEIDRRWGITGTEKAGIPLLGKHGIFNPWREDPKGWTHDDIANIYYEKVQDKWIIKDPYKGMRGKIKRDAEGFLYKYISGKSFEESLVLKAIWANNKISKNIKTRTDAMVIGGSLELFNGRYITAMFYVEALIAQGYTYDEAMKKIFNRMEMMNNTVIDRIKGLEKPYRKKQTNFLLDVLHNNRIDDSYIPGSAYE